jgi:hypothetical protein
MNPDTARETSVRAKWYGGIESAIPKQLGQQFGGRFWHCYHPLITRGVSGRFDRNASENTDPRKNTWVGAINGADTDVGATG